MTHKTHRMPLKYLYELEAATGRRYEHTDSKADPSIAIVSNAVVDSMINDLLELCIHLQTQRWI